MSDSEKAWYVATFPKGQNRRDGCAKSLATLPIESLQFKAFGDTQVAIRFRVDPGRPRATVQNMIHAHGGVILSKPVPFVD